MFQHDEQVSGMWLACLHGPLRRDALWLCHLGKTMDFQNHKLTETYFDWMSSWTPLVLQTFHIQRLLYTNSREACSPTALKMEHLFTHIQEHITTLHEVAVSFKTDPMYSIKAGVGDLTQELALAILSYMDQFARRNLQLDRAGVPLATSLEEDERMRDIATTSLKSTAYAQVVCYWLAVEDRPHDVEGSIARETLWELLPASSRRLYDNRLKKQFYKTVLGLQDKLMNNQKNGRRR